MNLLPCCGYFFELPAILLDKSKLLNLLMIRIIVIDYHFKDEGI